MMVRWWDEMLVDGEMRWHDIFISSHDLPSHYQFCLSHNLPSHQYLSHHLPSHLTIYHLIAGGNHETNYSLLRHLNVMVSEMRWWEMRSIYFNHLISVSQSPISLSRFLFILPSFKPILEISSSGDEGRRWDGWWW